MASTSFHLNLRPTTSAVDSQFINAYTFQKQIWLTLSISNSDNTVHVWQSLMHSLQSGEPVIVELKFKTFLDNWLPRTIQQAIYMALKRLIGKW